MLYFHLMKRSNDQTLKEALTGMLRSFHLEEKVNEGRLKENWEKLFGKTVMKYTRQIKVSNHKLFLTIDSAPLRQEMLYNKEKMVERINSEIASGMITDVILK